MLLFYVIRVLVLFKKKGLFQPLQNHTFGSSIIHNTPNL